MKEYLHLKTKQIHELKPREPAITEEIIFKYNGRDILAAQISAGIVEHYHYPITYESRRDYDTSDFSKSVYGPAIIGEPQFKTSNIKACIIVPGYVIQTEEKDGIKISKVEPVEEKDKQELSDLVHSKGLIGHVNFG